MKNYPQVLKELRRLGFRTDDSGGSSLCKIYPPDPKLPFYSFHSGERGLHPLRRYAKRHWNIDISSL